MANVIMSPHLKRVKVFIKNGQVYKGGIEEMFTANNLGRVGETDRVSEGTGESPETKKI